MGKSTKILKHVDTVVNFSTYATLVTTHGGTEKNTFPTERQ